MLKFKTNINCGGCVAKVTPLLNNVVGEGKWAVDVTATEKILTVENDAVTADQVKAGLDTLGYKADVI
jgi:copper chaperone